MISRPAWFILTIGNVRNKIWNESVNIMIKIIRASLCFSLMYFLGALGVFACSASDGQITGGACSITELNRQNKLQESGYESRKLESRDFSILTTSPSYQVICKYTKCLLKPRKEPTGSMEQENGDK